eukprot:scaffold1697_cov180-Amphora_coffeaeformis.AAC.39
MPSKGHYPPPPFVTDITLANIDTRSVPILRVVRLVGKSTRPSDTRPIDTSVRPWDGTDEVVVGQDDIVTAHLIRDD